MHFTRTSIRALRLQRQWQRSREIGPIDHTSFLLLSIVVIIFGSLLLG